MRNSLKILGAMIIVGAGALVYLMPYIKLEFAGFARYTEQDKRQYDFFTPDIVRNMPRISAHYDFDFSNVTGPAKHVHTVKFYGTDDTTQIEAYLASKTYQKQHTCDLNLSCWRSSDPDETIYVGVLTGEKTVIVQVITDFS